MVDELPHIAAKFVVRLNDAQPPSRYSLPTRARAYRRAAVLSTNSLSPVERGSTRTEAADIDAFAVTPRMFERGVRQMVGSGAEMDNVALAGAVPVVWQILYEGTHCGARLWPE